jgi:hypothetical protein
MRLEALTEKYDIQLVNGKEFPMSNSRHFPSPAIILTFAFSAWPIANSWLVACPFCSPQSQTFSEEIATMDAVAIAKIVKAPDPQNEEAAPKAQFQIQKVIKGESWVKPGETVEVLYYGDGNRDRSYLLMGSNAPTIMWSSPLGLSDRAEKYISHLPSLANDATRLEFFQEYLEDEDEMLARDAYDEFAKTPYKGVIELKDKIQHDRLIGWIKNPDVPAIRRRLYFTMLGVCGTPADMPLLEQMMLSKDRKQKAGLDALIACYLLLSGEDGLTMINGQFLDNPEADYADTYAAIMAIRFHGSEANRIPRARLVESLRHILERPSLADLVIPDLARWEDWEVMPTLVELFKNADEKSSWVRVPVINYLRSCPLPEAKVHIEELSKIDPEAVKRAQTFFPFNETGPTAVKQPTTDTPVPKPADASAILDAELNIAVKQPTPPAPEVTSASGGSQDIVPPQPLPPAEADAVTLTVADTGGMRMDPSTSELPKPTAAPTIASTPRATATTAAVNADLPPLPNLFVVWGVPVVCGAFLFILLHPILGVGILTRDSR